MKIVIGALVCCALFGCSQQNQEANIKGYDTGFNAGYEDGLKKAEILNEEAYNEAYDEGNSQGYEDGFKKGKDIGFQAGYEEGEKKGFDKGYEKGRKSEEIIVPNDFW